MAASVEERSLHLVNGHTELPVMCRVAEVQVPARIVAVRVSVGVVVTHRLQASSIACTADGCSIHDSGDTDPVELAALVPEDGLVPFAEGVLVPVVVVHPAM